MKKIIALIVAVVIIMASFSGCQNNEEKESDADKKPVVVATIFPFYDFAKNIVKDKMDIKMLVEPGKSSHDYKSNIDLADLTLVLQLAADGHQGSLTLVGHIEVEEVVGSFLHAQRNAIG